MDNNSQQMQTFCNMEQGLSYDAQMDTQHASLGNFGACALCAKAAAVIFCHNDNASLCSSCDLEIHASNPLAAQHERVPIVAKAQLESQISCIKVEAVEVKTASGGSGSTDEAATVADECDNAASLFTVEASTPLKPFKEFDAFDLDGTLFDMGLGFDLGTLEMDFLSCAPVDGVVPKVAPVAMAEAVEESSSSGCSSDSAAPAGGNLSSASSGDYRSQGAVDREAAAAPAAAAGAAAMPALPAAKPASSWGSADSDKPMNRLDRVRRYREKRARRTFQKTIRYQSRKAYAEIRPRIKGRFATREEVAALKAEAALKAANAAGMTPSSSYSNLRAPAMLYL